MLIPVLDHTAQAAARLAEQYKDKVRLTGLLAALTDQIQLIEDALWQLSSERYLDYAIGTQLDAIGVIVDQARGAMTDEEYRKALQAKIKVNRSSGTVEELLAVFHAVLPTSTNTLTLWPPACFTLELGDVVTAVQAALYVTFLRAARLAGVRGILLWKESPTASCFRFDTGPGYDQGRYAGAGV